MLNIFCSLFFVILSILHFTWAELTPESVSEGPCITDFGNNAATNLNVTWAQIPRDYYVAVGSKAFYRIWVKVLLGRYAKSEIELSEMKLKASLAPLGPLSSTYKPHGFSTNKFVYHTCKTQSISDYICRPSKKMKCSSPGTDVSAIKYTFETLIYTDNEKLMLYVQCYNNKTNAYKALSVSPTIDSKSKAIIRKKLTQLGFDSDLIYYPTY